MPSEFFQQSEDDHKAGGGMLPFVIILMIVLCVGLLVVIMKGAKHQELQERSRTLARQAHRTSTSLPPAIPKAPEVRATSTESVTEVERPVWLRTAPHLPDNVNPLHYELTLHPNLTAGTFRGWGIIEVRIVQVGTKHVVFHAHPSLNVSQVRITRGVVEQTVLESFSYPSHDFWVVETDADLMPGTRYQVHVRFEGKLLNTTMGLYRTSYVNSLTGELRYVMASKFSPTYARRAFPCFDEPHLKATYTISIVHRPEEFALSNMPLDEKFPMNEEGQLLMSRFHKSVPMATHHTCFIICDFNHTRTITARSGTEFRIFAPPDQLHKTRFALEIGARVLEFYEEYLNISYPLPKLDLIAVPDLHHGATQHFGLIAFKETHLLYDSKESSPQDKQQVALLVAHELAHMWFGDLVTGREWEDRWLAEGMATFLQYRGVKHVEPEWDMDNQFISEEMQPIMDLDSTTSSHALIRKLNRVEDVTRGLDDISYRKGAALFRMVRTMMGEDKFRAGLTSHLKHHAFKNAHTRDLWRDLARFAKNAPGKLETLMYAWTHKIGYPCINVRSDPFNDSKVFVKQEHFVRNYVTSSANKGDLVKRGYVWHVPLTYVTSNDRGGLIWLQDGKEVAVDLPLPPLDGWALFNANQTGYYLVNYDQNQWDHIIQRLLNNHQTISVADRAGLLHGAFSLASAGRLHYDVPLTISLYLRHERDLPPWRVAHTIFHDLQRLLEFSEVNPILRGYVKKLTGPIYKQLGWDQSDNHLDEILRTTIIELSCNSGNTDCLKEASVRLHAWMEGAEIPANMRALVYRYGMTETGREEHWAYLWNRYRVESSGQERLNLLYGLAHIREPWMIHRYLKYSLDESKVRRQDFFAVLGYIATNPVGRSLVWKFLRDEWSQLSKRFPMNDGKLANLVYILCKHFTTEFELQEVLDLLERYPTVGAWGDVASELVQSNILWLRRFEPAVAEWLRTEGYRPWFEPHLTSSAAEPIAYDVLIQPNIPGAEFHGRAFITLRLSRPTSLILLHASRLVVSHVRILRASTVIPIHRYFLYEPNQYLVIQTNVTLVPPEEYRLEFEYRGSLLTLGGLFNHVYRDELTGEKRNLILSRFQPSSARSAFPCFDEPRFKAIFDMAVSHDPSMDALSNMPEREVDIRADGIKTTRFQASVPMITARLSIVVLDLPHLEVYSTGGTKFRIYASSSKLNATNYAMECGISLVDFFEKFYDIRYPLPKQDIIAVPDLQEPGDDENWGLLVLQEEKAVLDPEEDSLEDQMTLALLLGHKFSQMWLGNLVTLSWWSDYWLQDSLAILMKYKALKTLRPEWNMDDRFLVDIYEPSLEKDASHFAYPVYKRAADPRQAFDNNAYLKGACLLRMLESFIQPDHFKEGISHYLKTHHHRQANPEDLWTSLSTTIVANIDIAGTMETWISQPGFPYLTIRRDPTEPLTFLAQQHRFLLNDGYESEDQTLQTSWTIPLTYKTAEDNQVKLIWIEGEEPVSFRISMTNPATSWVKFNVDRVGYLIVNYEDEDWAGLTAALIPSTKTKDDGPLEGSEEEDTSASTVSEDSEVSPPTPPELSPEVGRLSSADRAGLIGDAFLLARAGRTAYSTALDLTTYLRHSERSLSPWKAAVVALSQLALLLRESTEGYDLIKKYIQSLTRDPIANLTWNDTGDEMEKQLRTLLLDFSCAHEDPDCLAEASQQFTRWMEGERVPSNLRPVVYRYGLMAFSRKNHSAWDYVWNHFLNGVSSAAEQTRLLRGLAYASDRELLSKFVEAVSDLKLVRPVQFFQTLGWVADNPVGRPVVWRFLRERWKQLSLRYYKHQNHLHGLIKLIASYFDTEEHLQEVIKFFNTEMCGKELKQQVLGAISHNIRWLKSYKSDVIDWLRRTVDAPSS